MSLSDSYNTIIQGHYIVNEITGEIIDKLPVAGPPGREEAGPASGGLSSCHNTRKSEKKGVIKVYTDGSLIEVSKNRLSAKVNEDMPTRGKVTGFSKKSRLRFLKRMGQVNKSELPLFVTLTYPAEFPNDKTIYKADLEKFLKRLVYRFPKVAGFWRLEFQKRGAPHYHLLIWGLPYSKAIQKFISYLWYMTVKSGDEKHLWAGTQVQKVRSWRGVMSYASKYMAKEMDFGQECGRVWGYFNAGHIPWSKVLEVEISQEKVIKAMRLMRRYARIKARDFPSLTIFINDPDQWIRALDLI
jgi:hypothetical protein